MRILIIGGTRFVGRHITAAALARGHDVVLFNRGNTNPELFQEVVQVRGDRRSGGLAKLAGQEFDAVFDTAPYHPDDVAATASMTIGDGLYCMVSSISVYRDPVSKHADETAPVWRLPGPLPEEFSTPEEYGAMKAACESKAKEMYGDNTLIVRPGLVVGPYDYTDRLTSWLRRMTSREVILAAEADQPVQLIDVRDNADWMIRAAEERTSGVFNAVGPTEPISFAELLATAAEAFGLEFRVRWAGDRFLEERKVSLPLWIPRADHAFFELSNARALQAGLVLRPLAETLLDVQEWDERRSDHEEPALPATVEEELLREL